MSKTFRYTRVMSRAYDSYRDSYEDDGIEFDYEVSNDELLPVIVNTLFEDYFEKNKQIAENRELVRAVKASINEMVTVNDLVDIFVEAYEDDLKEIFRDDAMDWFNG